MESTQSKPMRVYTDGIYDLFHRGHVESINQCKSLYPNTYLIVGVINDNDATNYKRKPIYNESDRYKIIENLKSVNKMIPNAPLQLTKEFLDENEIDMVVHGLANPEDANKQEDFYTVAKEMNKFKEVSYYKGVSTTDIIDKIKNLKECKIKPSMFQYIFDFVKNAIKIYRCATYNFWLGGIHSPITTPNLYKSILESNDISQNSKILDIGVGSGVYFHYQCITDIIKNKQLKIKGIDIDDDYIQDAQKIVKKKNLNNNVNIECIDLFKYKPQDKFDNILFMESAPVMNQDLIIQMINYIEDNNLKEDKKKGKIIFINNLIENASPFYKFCKKNIVNIPFVNVDFGNTLNRQFFYEIEQKCKHRYNINIEVLASQTIGNYIKKLFTPFPIVSHICITITGLFVNLNTNVQQYKIEFTRK